MLKSLSPRGSVSESNMEASKMVMEEHRLCGVYVVNLNTQKSYHNYAVQLQQIDCSLFFVNMFPFRVQALESLVNSKKSFYRQEELKNSDHSS